MLKKDVRISKTEKIPVLNIEGFAYTLFYFSCMLTNNKVWLWKYDRDQPWIWCRYTLWP